MGALTRTQASDCTNPVLDIYTPVNGVLTDVYVLQFQVFDVSDAGKQASPVQVYPATTGERATVDIATVCPDDGAGKLGTGHYVAGWTPSSTEPVGTHRIRWFFKLTSTSPEQSFQEEFEVLGEAIVAVGDGYCLVADLRDEGVPITGPTAVSDAWLIKKILLASRMLDRWTGRFFSPRTLSLKLNGSGRQMLLLDVPIIAVETVFFETSPFFPSSLQIDADLLRVYNRHLTQGLTQPDDRDNPKIELFHASYDLHTTRGPYQFTRLIFPEGQQNVTVNGVFGYTDPAPPSTVGATPELIRHVTKLMVMRELEKMTSAKRSQALNLSRVTMERTRDQQIQYDSVGKAGQNRAGPFTGDPEIDVFIASFMRPPILGSA